MLKFVKGNKIAMIENDEGDINILDEELKKTKDEVADEKTKKKVN